MSIIFWRQKKQENRRIAKEPEEVSAWPLPRIAGTATIAVLVIVGLSMVVGKLSDPETLPMRQVQLEAPFVHVSKEELYSVIAANAKGGFFNIDVDGITASVEGLPWVAQAEARRIWPDTLNVTVHEQKAVARWGDNALVNVKGELFYPASDKFPAGLVELFGPDAAVSAVTTQLVKAGAVLKPLDLALARLELTPRRAWELELSNGVVVTLGRENVEQRLQRFVKFYPQLASMGADMRRVDMRYTNGFSVQWQQMPAA